MAELVSFQKQTEELDCKGQRLPPTRKTQCAQAEEVFVSVGEGEENSQRLKVGELFPRSCSSTWILGTGS